MSSVTNLNLAISTYGYGEASLFMFTKSLVERDKSCYTDEIKVYGDEGVVSRKIVDLYQEKQWLCGLIGDEDASYISLYPTAIAKDPAAMITVNGGCDSSTVTIYGDRDRVDNIKEYLSSILELVGKARIHWYYGNQGQSTTVPVSSDRLPVGEMYPNLTTSLSKYYDNYLNSSASILILIGPPGTGKTSFLRGLLHHSQSSATVAYDPKILEEDGVFVSFISGKDKFMILEDADSFLASRNKGNTVMHKFLNVGDGLVSCKNKKLIFTTNLPSTRDIDPALTRPGRCFDILHFNKLNQDQSKGLIDKLSLDISAPEEDVTLAELLNSEKSRANRGVGF